MKIKNRIILSVLLITSINVAEASWSDSDMSVSGAPVAGGSDTFGWAGDPAAEVPAPPFPGVPVAPAAFPAVPFAAVHPAPETAAFGDWRAHAVRSPEWTSDAGSIASGVGCIRGTPASGTRTAARRLFAQRDEGRANWPSLPSRSTDGTTSSRFSGASTHALRAFVAARTGRDTSRMVRSHLEILANNL